MLISKKSASDARRWVYLDIGKFGGLAETMDEAIQYPIVDAAQGQRRRRWSWRVRPATAPMCSTRRRTTACRRDLEIGDKVEIRATGAYTSTYASVAFNGFEPLSTYCI